jgi:hypothetical protein
MRFENGVIKKSAKRLIRGCATAEIGIKCVN